MRPESRIKSRTLDLHCSEHLLYLDSHLAHSFGENIVASKLITLVVQMYPPFQRQPAGQPSSSSPSKHTGLEVNHLSSSNIGSQTLYELFVKRIPLNIIVSICSTCKVYHKSMGHPFLMFLCQLMSPLNCHNEHARQTRR